MIRKPTYHMSCMLTELPSTVHRMSPHFCYCMEGIQHQAHWQHNKDMTIQHKFNPGLLNSRLVHIQLTQAAHSQKLYYDQHTLFYSINALQCPALILSFFVGNSVWL